jgi:hypothetical protein
LLGFLPKKKKKKKKKKKTNNPFANGKGGRLLKERVNIY